MTTHNAQALEFLMTRRSRPAKTLVGPAPDRDAIEQILTIGARTPDHGMLVPWRFIVLQDDALQRMAAAVEARAIALGKPEEQVQKARSSFANAPASIVVVASPKASEKIPEIEQTLCAGAVCLSVLNGALASGLGANWITGWMAFDGTLCQSALGLSDREFVAGFIHVGRESVRPSERKRPDLNQITDWVSA